jgi:pimeloyl-ACP methyl ester carboxylesterase
MTTIYASAEGALAIEQRYRGVLERWPVPSEHLTVPTCEGDTFVVACGPPDAPPVVLLHGAGANSAMWMGDVASWSRHVRVYAVDVIGEPGRSAPSRPSLASEAYALWLDDVLRGLAVDRASIVGMSFGGWLALDYAIRRPARVDRLVLVCPGGIGRQKVGVVLVALLLRPFGRWGLRTTMRFAMGDLPPDDDVVDYFMLIHRHFRPRRDVLPRFSDASLRDLAVPVLAIVGGRDTMLDSHGTRRRLERNQPRATVRLLPHAGHVLLGQTEPVLAFLRDLGNPGHENEPGISKIAKSGVAEDGREDQDHDPGPRGVHR